MIFGEYLSFSRNLLILRYLGIKIKLQKKQGRRIREAFKNKKYKCCAAFIENNGGKK